MKMLVSGALAVFEKSEAGLSYCFIRLPSLLSYCSIRFFLLFYSVNSIADSSPSENGSTSPFFRLLFLLISAEKVLVLVLLYSISNLLSYYALARVDAAVYTVLLQVGHFIMFFDSI